jgi:hypothetical protein
VLLSGPVGRWVGWCEGRGRSGGSRKDPFGSHEKDERCDSHEHCHEDGKEEIVHGRNVARMSIPPTWGDAEGCPGPHLRSSHDRERNVIRADERRPHDPRGTPPFAAPPPPHQLLHTEPPQVPVYITIRSQAPHRPRPSEPRACGQRTSRPLPRPRPRPLPKPLPLLRSLTIRIRRRLRAPPLRPRSPVPRRTYVRTRPRPRYQTSFTTPTPHFEHQTPSKPYTHRKT